MKLKYVLMSGIVIIIIAFITYRIGFEAGREYTKQLDSGGQKTWKSKKWGYEITFPESWDNIKRHDPSIKGMGADVFCGSRSGASTAVFVYPGMNKSYTIDEFADGILKQYEAMVKTKIYIKDEKKYEQNGLKYKIVIFQQDKTTHHYAFVFTNTMALAISSFSESKMYDVSKQDFENIIKSVKLIEE